jgi:Na+/proline symporter
MEEYIPLAIIVAYLVVVTVVGAALSRRTRSSSDWAVAGGGMSMLMVSVGVAGSRIGGGGTYGVAGNVMNGDLGGGMWNMWWYSISTIIAMALVGGFYAVPFRRLKLHTVGEIFAHRFGSARCQALTSLCVQTEYLLVNVIEAYVIGIILTGVTGLPMYITVAIAALILITYISLGGLWGSAATNLIHCATILIGLGLVGYLGIGHLGGWDAMTVQIDAHLAEAGKDRAIWWSFTGASGFAVFGLVFSSAIHTPAASVYTNFATSARSEKIILPAFLAAGVIASIMPLLAGLVGMETLAAKGLDPGLGGYKNLTALPTEINVWVGGIALAAILAAVISSGGPILLSSSTMIVRDWLTFTRKYSSQKKLRAYRITTIVYGVIAAILAYLWSIADAPLSIMEILLFGFAMVVPPAIAIGYVIYYKRTTEAGAYWGMIVGYAGGIVAYGLIRWAEGVDFTAPEGSSLLVRAVHLFFRDFMGTGTGLDPSYLTTLLPLIAVPLFSAMTRPNPEGEEKFYAIVSGEREMEAE